ncbi:hypothetical protein OSB04_un000865, partial [Centaurea solstitialis]
MKAFNGKQELDIALTPMPGEEIYEEVKNEYKDFKVCPRCGKSRWKVYDKTGKLYESVPAKVLWYFPIIPRMKRLFQTKTIAKDLIWHETSRKKDGVLRHPGDSQAWREIDHRFPEIANDPRNLRLGISADGVDINRRNRHQSVWPVLTVIYNLLSWLCMKGKFIMLSLLISGVETYDAHTQEMLTLHAVVLWTINDYPALGTLYGCTYSGYKGCVVCRQKTQCVRLPFLGKQSYVGHRRQKMDWRLEWTWCILRLNQNWNYKQGNGTILPTACYTLTKEEKDKFCETLYDLRVPQGYCSNFASLNEFKDFKVCPRCGKSRWKVDDKTEKLYESVPAKVLWYFLIIPRMKRLFQTKTIAKDLIWHETSRKKDGVLRHPADSQAWMEIDHSGYKGCVVCRQKTQCVRLPFLGKRSYVRHRRYLPYDRTFRRQRKAFNGKQELDIALTPMPEEEIYEGNEYKDFKVCPRCGKSRWKVDDKMGKLYESVRQKYCDGVDVNRGNRHHSVWPVLTVIYNIPPWLCMKRKFIMLSSLISSTPCNDIDVFLEPLLDDLQFLFETGVETYDTHTQEMFTLHAVVLWTINDYLALGTLCGCPYSGYKGYVVCRHKTQCVRLPFLGKQSYVRHRRYLPYDRTFRRQRKAFNGKQELDIALTPMPGEEIYEEWWQDEENQNRLKWGNKETTYWKKYNIWQRRLIYWRYSSVQHCIDFMHVEKNVCESLIGTLLHMPGKTKDGLEARMDLVHIALKPEQEPTNKAREQYSPQHSTYGASDKFFNELLVLLKKMLPEGNEMMGSTYVAKKTMKAMGSEYTKIHACINDRVLYRNEYKDFKVCPRCGKSRWKVDDKTGKLYESVLAKVLWYFLIIPRMKRLFQTKTIAKDLIWHETRVETYDTHTQEMFTLHAVVLWTINDYLALGTLCGCPYSGYKGYVVCRHKTQCVRLPFLGKQSYVRHRRYLPYDRTFRRQRKAFNGKQELDIALTPMPGEEIYEEWWQDEENQNRLKWGNKETTYWKKYNIWQRRLIYWRYSSVQHCIDFMHVEKNVCESLIGTLLHMPGKIKDGLEARMDLVHIALKPEQEPTNKAREQYSPQHSTYGASDKFFNELLVLLKKMLPEGNEMMGSTYVAKKTMKAMGSEYTKIHACINDRVLYRNEYKDFKVCPRCGKSRWKVDDKTGKLYESVLAKVLWYFLIIPRMKRLFQTKTIAKDLIWHETRVETYDTHTQEMFTLHAVVLWTINDYLALGTLCGCPYSGYKGCVVCRQKTQCVRLPFLGKQSYVRHRRYLPYDRTFRRQRKAFNGKQELDIALTPMPGEEIYEEEFLQVSTGSGGKMKRIKTGSNGGNKETTYWKKYNIWQRRLMYWRYSSVQHCIDFMHVEKNVCESLIGTLLHMPGKTKDGLETRMDLVHFALRPELEPTTQGNGTILPAACYTLTKEEKDKFCETLYELRVPQGHDAVESVVRGREAPLAVSENR